jgi:hypothetical protein
MDEIKTNVDETMGNEPKADEPKVDAKTVEEQMAELLAENKRMRKAVDKATADASDWKKKFLATQSESEKLSMEKAERDAALKEELEALRKESKVNKFAKSFMACGYSEEMATKAAEAQYSGDTDELFRLQKLHSENMAKQIRADIMKSMPVPATGNDDSVHITQEQFDKMSLAEQTDLYEKHPSVYKQLAGY